MSNFDNESKVFFMFDDVLLCRVLFFLAREPDSFLVSQDAFPTLKSCIVQLQEIESVLATLHSYNINTELRMEVHNKVQNIKERKTCWIEKLEKLKQQASRFWLCAPCDCDDSMSDSTESKQWVIYSSSRNLSDEKQTHVRIFQNSVLNVCRSEFPDYLEQIQTEEAEEQEIQERMNALPMGKFACRPSTRLKHLFHDHNRSFVLSAVYPLRHFSVFDEIFATKLGYCSARLICQPLLEFIQKAIEFDELITKLNGFNIVPPAIITYRRADRSLLRVLWEFSDCALDGYRPGHGFDVTAAIDHIYKTESISTGRMLRQWLHSIRNASFGQQAEFILEDAESLRSLLIPSFKDPLILGSDTEIDQERVSSLLESLSRGLKTLKHSANITVDMIDQALEVKNPSQHMSVAGFLDSLRQSPHNVAHRENCGQLLVDFESVLDGQSVQVADCDDLYVGGEVSNVQCIMNNLISNAVRYTDRVEGMGRLAVDVRMRSASTVMHFEATVRDYCSMGLPSTTLEYFRRELGDDKCVDTRRTNAAVGRDQQMRNYKLSNESHDMSRTDSQLGSEHSSNSTSTMNFMSHDYKDMDASHYTTSSSVTTAVQSSRSSGTGLPHIIELYKRLRGSLQDHFDMVVATHDDGTTFTLRFTLKRISPSTVHTRAASVVALRSFANETKKVLIVDDATVVRQIMKRMLTQLHVPFHICENGVEAIEWFRDNHRDCAVVVTDLEMPEMSGFGLTKLVRDLDSTFPCYIVSGRDVRADEDDYVEVDGVLTKPLSIERLQKVLCTVYFGSTN